MSTRGLHKAVSEYWQSMADTDNKKINTAAVHGSYTQETLGCTASTGSLQVLVSKVGSLALNHNPGRAVLVFKNFYEPGAPRPVIIIGFGEWDVLAQHLERECPTTLSVAARLSGWLLSGRRPGRLGLQAGAARWLPRLLLLHITSHIIPPAESLAHFKLNLK